MKATKALYMHVDRKYCHNMLDVLAYNDCIAFFCNLEVSKNTLENEGKYPGKVY